MQYSPGTLTIPFAALIVVLAAACGNPKEGAVSGTPAVDGEKAYQASCQSCHGSAGQGDIRFRAPVLAGLDKAYLKRQMENFVTGNRGYDPLDTPGIQMAAMAKAFPDTSLMTSIARYLGNLNPPVHETSAGDERNGAGIYQNICGSCHGQGGHGNPALNAPPLHTQPSWYLISQLAKFRDGMRGGKKEDVYGSQMAAVMQLVPDEKSLKDVIVYLRSQNR